jgi:hypothetical protein
MQLILDLFVLGRNVIEEGGREGLGGHQGAEEDEERVGRRKTSGRTSEISGFVQ